MKTTLELPDDLFREAKATAARKGTTLRALVAEALVEKLRPKPAAAAAAAFRLKALPRRHEPPVTPGLVEQLDAESDR